MLALLLSLVVSADPMKFDPKQNVQRHPDGGLWVGIASEKQTVQGVPIPRDTVVDFSESGGITGVTFPADTEWSGVKWKENETVDFDENGAIVGGTCAKDFKSGGLVFAAGKPLEFFPTKKGKTPKVSRGTVIAGQKVGDLQLAADSEVVFQENGKVGEAVSGAQQKFKNLIPLNPGMKLTFHPNGMIESVTNDWGVGFYDERGKATRHKEYAR
jgi:hypothetical protein